MLCHIQSMKIPITFRLEDWLLAGLDVVREGEKFPPARTAVFEDAIKDYLKARNISLDDHRILEKVRAMQESDR